MPAAFPEWRAVLDGWGALMVGAVTLAAQMAARGFGLPADAFTRRMARGPHLLAPTGTDLERHSAVGTVYAGYHYDLNFLTIHGRSRCAADKAVLSDAAAAAVLGGGARPPTTPSPPPAHHTEPPARPRPPSPAGSLACTFGCATGGASR